ncbi:MAG: DUF2911 domain-containing protein [Gemmatimonadales bacterium]
MTTDRPGWILRVIALAGLGLAGHEARAQAIPFSQHGTVSQRVGLTDIVIEYNRPVARGRELFPGVVNWGRIWNPGADSATRIAFSRDVVVEGTPVTAGEYSIWIIPRETEPWLFILHRAARVFHTPFPGEEGEALRVPVRPVSGDPMEALAWYFPVVARDSTMLHLHWGRTVIPIRIRAPLPE